MAARPIVLDAPTRDPRAELNVRLQHAPQEHAEALLAAYEVLQGLHDRGALELLRGLLGSSDAVLEIAVDAIKGPQAIRTIRNLLVLANALGAVEPEQLSIVSRVLPQAVNAAAARSKPQSLLRLATGFLWNRDVRRALTASQAVLAVVGKALSSTAEME
jgi:uncharacterized protein YjgD (DUF1641 family)